jgi:1-acyl-sn-glycerol-3-phosphate acyltransferase
MDIAVVGAQLPCVFLAKQEVARWPLVGRSARLAGTVFVERGSRASGVMAVKALRELLERRVTVAVFPEGTTTRGPGLLAFQGGIFRQASQMGAAVVPLALAYDDPADGWTNDDGSFVDHFLHQFGKRRITASLSFGPPLRDKSAASLRKQTHAWIAGQLKQGGATSVELGVSTSAGDSDDASGDTAA